MDKLQKKKSIEIRDDCKMKILVVGLGSMGKRRVRNLQTLNIKNILGFDLKKDRRTESENKYGIQTYDNFERAIDQIPEALIISVPPDVHIKYQMFAAKNNIPFFTEASVLDEGMEELIEMIELKNIIGVPSSTLRFHPAIKKIKELVDKNEIGKLCTFTYHSGQYLPDWHPWEKVTDFYVSKKETGGCREIIPFELSWITWIFGEISSVFGNIQQTLDFGSEIDDIYHAFLEFKSGLTGHLLVDTISRVAYRDFKLLGEEGVIEWDWNKSEVRCFKTDIMKWKTYNLNIGEAAEEYNPNITEEMYISELDHFIKAVENKEEYGYSLRDDLKVLKILYKIEESNEKKIKLDL